MADVSMKDFLLQYYMQLRFNDMPAEVRAKFDEFVSADDFRGNMKQWKSKLMHQDPATGRWVQNALPDATDPTGDYHLKDSEWEKLFKAFQNAFRAMEANADSFKDNSAAKAFLAEYFGDATKLFGYATASTEAEAEIAKLKRAFDTYPQLEAALRQMNIVPSDFSFSKFKSGLGSQKYNKDPKFQQQLVDLANNLQWAVQQSESLQALFPDIDFGIISGGFESQVDAVKLARFKQNYGTLLTRVATDSKVRDVFSRYDGGEISGRIEDAKQKVAYDDKNNDDYIPPKRKDETTFWQDLKQNLDDKYQDVLGKHLKPHGNRVYYSKSAKFIVDAVDGLKIKATDGLAKVLENSSKIKEKLQYKSPTATKHFDWFNKTMSELKTTMPKAFDGALRKGTQMKAIVAEMIKMAVRNGKMDEAKTALEVLSVLKYDYTTSKTMDALGKETLTIFSDGGLSWNKNEGMAFVTKALDKTIWTAFMTVGYGITIAGNAYNLSGSKFNGDRGRIRGDQTAWAAQNRADRQNAENLRNANNVADAAARASYQAELARLNTGTFAINDANIAARRAQLDAQKNRDDTEGGRLDAVKNSPRYTNAETLVSTVDALHTAMSSDYAAARSLHGDIGRLRADIAALDAQINDPATYAGMPAPAANQKARNLYNQKQAKETLLKDKTTERRTKLGNVVQKRGEYRRLTGQRWTAPVAGRAPTHGAGYDNAQGLLARVARREARHNRNVADTGTKADLVTRFEEATSTVREINDRMDARNAEINEWDAKHQDNYRQLMAYWDMLESGRNTHTGKAYKWDLLRSNKHSQSVFDAQKAAIISEAQAGYSYAA